MSSNYQFVSTDTEPLVALMIAAYEELTGTTVYPASPERLFILWVADVIVQTRAQINYAANQNIPSRASGANLDALGELFAEGVRPPAAAASCTMRFSISEAQTTSILIPKGTRVTDISGALEWLTTEDTYIPIGETTIDVSAQCATAGTVGNGYAPGQIVKIADPFIYFQHCENITESAGGHDAASDAEFYELLRASQDTYSTAGPRGGYIYLAKQVSTDIADVVANSPAAGQVNIYILMNDGDVAGEEIKNAVLTNCSDETVRPLTDLVRVEDPVQVDYDIHITYYIPNDASRSADEIQAAVESAVAEYAEWQCAKLGRDINPSKLTSLLMSTGIKRVVVDSPTFVELSDGSDNDAPRVARQAAVSITNGGYEDE